MDGWMGAATALVCLFSVFGSRPPAKQGSAATWVGGGNSRAKGGGSCVINIGFEIFTFPSGWNRKCVFASKHIQ